MPETAETQPTEESSERPELPSAANEDVPQAPPAAASADQAAFMDLLRDVKAMVANLATKPSEPVAANEDTEVTKSLKARLEALEKSFGLPASQSNDSAQGPAAAHSWPFDINEKRGV